MRRQLEKYSEMEQQSWTSRSQDTLRLQEHSNRVNDQIPRVSIYEYLKNLSKLKACKIQWKMRSTSHAIDYRICRKYRIPGCAALLSSFLHSNCDWEGFDSSFETTSASEPGILNMLRRLCFLDIVTVLADIRAKEIPLVLHATAIFTDTRKRKNGCMIRVMGEGSRLNLFMTTFSLTNSFPSFIRHNSFKTHEKQICQNSARKLFK